VVVLESRGTKVFGHVKHEERENAFEEVLLTALRLVLIVLFVAR
jgi:hypothetical protein